MRLLAGSTLALLVGALSALGATFTVDRTDDPTMGANACTVASNDCSLRGAVASANGIPGSMIDIPAGTYTLSQVPSGMTVSANTSVQGAGAATTIIDAQFFGRVFKINAGVTATIDDVTIRNGSTSGGDAEGGCIQNSGTLTITDAVVQSCTTTTQGGGLSNLGTMTLVRASVLGNTSAAFWSGGGVVNNESATLTITDSTIDDNTCPNIGGGLANAGTATIVGSTISRNDANNGAGMWSAGNASSATIRNSTLSGNIAQFSGGGLAVGTGTSTATLENVTITNNSVTNGNGGGVANGLGGTLVARNTIIAGNTASLNNSLDCQGSLTSGGYVLIQTTTTCTIGGNTMTNVLGMSPLLGMLADNGGPTLTHLPGVGSPAVEGGNPAMPGSGGNACTATDQRGITRPQGAQCDIGAVEGSGAPTTTTSSSTSTSTSSSSSSTLPPPTTTTSSTTSTSNTTSTSTTTSTTMTTLGAPTARLTATPNPSCTGLEMTLNGSTSSSPNGPIVAYRFETVGPEQVAPGCPPHDPFWNPTSSCQYCVPVTTNRTTLIQDSSAASIKYTFTWHAQSCPTPSVCGLGGSKCVGLRDPASVKLTIQDVAGAQASVTVPITFAQASTSASRAPCPGGGVLPGPSGQPVTYVNTVPQITSGVVTTTLGCTAITRCVGNVAITTPKFSLGGLRGTARATDSRLGAKAAKAKLPTVYADGSFALEPGETATVEIPITKKGKRIFKRKKAKVTILITTLGDDGEPVVTTRVETLRRQ